MVLRGIVGRGWTVDTETVCAAKSINGHFNPDSIICLVFQGFGALEIHSMVMVTAPHMIPHEKIDDRLLQSGRHAIQAPELHAKHNQILAIAPLQSRLSQPGAFLSVLFIGAM